MKMKNKFLLILFFNFYFLNLSANTLDLQNKYISLKDFIILKYDIFFKENTKNVFQGGGAFGVLYQNLNYNINIDKNNNINISINAFMHKKRYQSKKYYPKLRDCIQIRNKIFVNKYGYSFFSQKFNNLVDEEVLSNVINNQILNISSLDENVKKKILDITTITINIKHPKKDKSLSCSGNLISSELKK
jgi:hypothetical protein